MNTPETIWLLDMGDSICWHDDPNPAGLDGDEKPDAVEYVRADSLAHLESHPDDLAVERFAKDMKAKLAVARAKGRGGWDNPDLCSGELLAGMLVGRVGKGNAGNLADIANLAMMLHQRGEDPVLVSNSLAQLKAKWQAEAQKSRELQRELAQTRERLVSWRDDQKRRAENEAVEAMIYAVSDTAPDRREGKAHSICRRLYRAGYRTQQPGEQR